MNPSPPPRRRRSNDPASRPHISEWFGHRVFPAVSAAPAAINDQRSGRCPFLSQTLRQTTTCIKAENSSGVCTISATSNGTRQDWLVCPYRALDDSLLASMVRRLYELPDDAPVLIRPALALRDETLRDEATSALRQDDPCRVFVYFQDKLGGEIGLSATTASPELSFDITVVELLAPDHAQEGPAYPLTPQIKIGRYGVIELQTSDTHGSYKQAVTALTNALDLHRNHFPQLLAENPEWAGRKVEGPNISNVFKRTFYQIAFKFQVTKRDTFPQLRAPCRAGGDPRELAVSGSVKLTRVMRGRNKVSGAAEAAYLADVALAARFDDLLAAARDAEQAYRQAQAVGAPVDAQYQLARKLDAVLTDAMRAAYAAQRAEIGPLGYEDRIFRRKAKAKPAVHAWTDEAERLLTLRETYLLTGFPARPETEALGIPVARFPMPEVSVHSAAPH